MSHSALDSYLSSWREADPQRTYAWLFLRRAERLRYGVCAAVIDEWLKALRDVQEPQVAVAKLGWWREELLRAAEGEGHHPLTQSLFAEPRGREVPSSCWTAVVDAGLLAIAAPPAADFAAQHSAARPLAKAIAELETRVWFGAREESSRAVGVTAVANLVADMRALATRADHGRSPLPMNLMARHGLSFEGLAEDGLDRRAAMRDYAALLRNALTEAATMPGPLTLFRAVGLQHDLRSLDRAARADNPLRVLRAPRLGFATLLKTWRAARTWRGISNARMES